MKHLIIIGVGGFAREVYWHAQDSIGYGTEWDLKGFLDGDVKLSQEEYVKLPMPVYGNVEDYTIQVDDVFICAIGNPFTKKKLVEKIISRGGDFINIIHKTAIVHGNVILGKGIILCQWVNLHDHTVCGDYVTFNTRAGAGHDSVIGEYSSFMGNTDVCGNVKVGSCTYWGNGSLALPHSIIEDEAYIGCHSVVFKHVKFRQKVYGNPAVPI